MSQQVFIKVVGFSDVERHALNTVFRLSEERPTRYKLWSESIAQLPRFALLDSESFEARMVANRSNGELKVGWIGDNPPELVWRVFPRPVSWTDVVSAMDELFTPNTEIEFDLDLGLSVDEAAAQPPAAAPEPLDQDTLNTVPPEEPAEPTPRRRGLIVSPDLNQRLYLRAKLALNHLTVADEAETVAQALELLKDRKYTVALVDFAAEGAGWDFIRQLRQSQPLQLLVAIKDRPGLGERLRARFSGIHAFLAIPPDPEKLHQLLRQVQAQNSAQLLS